MLLVDIASFETALRDGFERMVTDGDSPNQISTEAVRSWTAEYLRERNEDLIRHPELRDEQHWNLFALDGADDEAVFVIVFFSTDQFDVLTGRGDFASLRHFGENFDGSNDSVIAKARQQFPETVGIFSLPIQQAYCWLESV